MDSSKIQNLQVACKSNVNEFVCDISNYYQPDTLAYSDEGTCKAVRLTGNLQMEVELASVRKIRLLKSLKRNTNPLFY